MAVIPSKVGYTTQYSCIDLGATQAAFINLESI